jgi:sulfonate dioxygenase
LHSADDLTVRWKWEPGSVAFWDNRVVAHRAIPGGYNPEEREGKRTCVYGEKPFFDPENSVSLSDYKGKPESVPKATSNGTHVSNGTNGVHTTNGTNGHIEKPLTNGKYHLEEVVETTGKNGVVDVNETNVNKGP